MVWTLQCFGKDFLFKFILTGCGAEKEADCKNFYELQKVIFERKILKMKIIARVLKILPSTLVML